MEERLDKWERRTSCPIALRNKPESSPNRERHSPGPRLTRRGVSPKAGKTDKLLPREAEWPQAVPPCTPYPIPKSGTSTLPIAAEEEDTWSGRSPHTTSHSMDRTNGERNGMQRRYGGSSRTNSKATSSAAAAD